MQTGKAYSKRQPLSAMRTWWISNCRSVLSERNIMEAAYAIWNFYYPPRKNKRIRWNLVIHIILCPTSQTLTMSMCEQYKKWLMKYFTLCACCFTKSCCVFYTNHDPPSRKARPHWVLGLRGLFSCSFGQLSALIFSGFVFIVMVFKLLEV